MRHYADHKAGHWRNANSAADATVRIPDVPLRLLHCWSVAVGRSSAHCVRRGVDLNWDCGIGISAVGVCVSGPSYGGTAHCRSGHYLVRRSVGHGCDIGCAAM